MAIQHIAFVEWKADADPAVVEAFLSAVRSFPDKIDGVEKVELGRTFTERAGNFTHAAIVTMRDRDVLASYGPHPVHQAAVAIAEPALANMLVADIEV